MRSEIYTGDCRDVMALVMGANEFDAIVTDPPYELGFMGKTWDASGVAFDPNTWRECLRVLKPGGYLLAFGGSRTYHRITCAIEDAGFEIRDCIMWLYGSGFPKSHNLDGEREGWGTALKPAHEPIVVARKPLIGTVAANVLQFGTGALNIAACRVPGIVSTNPLVRNAAGFQSNGLANQGTTGKGNTSEGRWPANVIHDGSDEVVNRFPHTASGTGAVKRASSKNGHGNTGAALGAESRPAGTPMIGYGDEGSASRFFYCAKANTKDRNDGCEALTPTTTTTDGRKKPIDNAYLRGKTERRNTHPTVKPTALMRYLCRLVTPMGGIVLDPFNGSGSTGKAATLEGFGYVGIEQSAEYAEISRARIKAAA